MAEKVRIISIESMERAKTFVAKLGDIVRVVGRDGKVDFYMGNGKDKVPNLSKLVYPEYNTINENDESVEIIYNGQWNKISKDEFDEYFIPLVDDRDAITEVIKDGKTIGFYLYKHEFKM